MTEITANEWGGEFGDEYTERQQLDTTERRHFWDALVDEYDIKSVLEVGCNTGDNLASLKIPCSGVDVNQNALDLAPPHVKTFRAPATDIPVATNGYDLVFTFGVLIHIPPEDIEQAMREIVRCSRRYVFCGEYLGNDEVPYRDGVLWRRDYGKLYQDIGLELIEMGTFRGEPWDRNDVTWWLLKQPEVKSHA